MSDRLLALLDGLGLSEYFDLLSAERIEPEDIAFLSDADLAGLGLPMGPRRRLMRAVGTGGAAALREGPVQERRNLTVLFCDMVDSTSAASRLDPEDLQIRFRDFREACEAAIHGEDGYVAHRLGDGLMAYFGFPEALEDAALCAVHAGLDIVARTAALETPGGPVGVRVGIASGMTIIEDSRLGGEQSGEIATGLTLALAARLQAIAGPGEVVLSDTTRRLLRNAIALQPLGLKSLKGFPEKEAVWQAIGRGDDPMVDGDAPLPVAFFGRDRELSELLGLWQATRNGNGGAVLIDGEAGIGKSRLLGELRRAVQAEAEVVVLHCYRHRHGAALHPVTDWLEASIGVEDTIARLESLPGVSKQNAPLIARIMGLGGTVQDAETERPELQAEILEAVVSLLSPTAGRPRLVLIEDLHWADAVTLNVLDRLAEQSALRSLMVAATIRPGPPRLPDGFRRITLAPLAEAAIHALVAGQLGATTLSPQIRQTVAERSGGVPFFAEELTRAVLEAHETDRAVVPLTLQDTLMARLDRLGAGKTVAQIGALMGRGFNRELLAAMSNLSPRRIDEALEALLGADLVRTEPGQDGSFVFRHALVRDVAYESMLRSRRTILHRRFADTIVTRFPAIAAAQPELVAHHYTESDNAAAAIPFWEKAADLAVNKAAPAPAIGYYRKALDLLARQPESSDRDSQEAALRIRLNMPLTVTTGFASADTEVNLSHLAALFENLEPGEAALQLLWSRSMSALVRADLLTSRRTALQLGRLAERASLPDASRMPERILGYIAMVEGDLAASKRHFRNVLDGYAPDGFDPILPGHPFDVLASSLSQRAILMALVDRAEAVDADQDKALARASGLDNPATTFQVLVHLCLARFELDDHEGLVPLVGKLRDVVNRHQISPLYVNVWEAWLMARDGALEEGLTGIARARKDAAQYPLWMPRATLLEADLLAGAGRHADALALLGACEVEIARTRHTYLLAETLRRKAVYRAALDAEPAETEGLLREALAVARRQGARRFERAAQRDLDQLRRRGGGPADGLF